MIEYVPTGGVDESRIREFLLKIHEEYFQGLPYEFDVEAYPRKLAERAEGFVSRRPDGSYEGVVLGYANDAETKRAYISYIAKALSAPRGMGSELHESFRRLARERGMKKISLEVLASNTKARAFYAHLGYSIQEERAGRSLLCLAL